MSERRERLKERSCDGKVAMGAKAARQSAEKVRERLGDSRVSAYRCIFCGQWHIGHCPSEEGVVEIARVIREETCEPTSDAR